MQIDLQLLTNCLSVQFFCGGQTTFTIVENLKKQQKADQTNQDIILPLNESGSTDKKDIIQDQLEDTPSRNNAVSFLTPRPTNIDYPVSSPMSMSVLSKGNYNS